MRSKHTDRKRIDWRAIVSNLPVHASETTLAQLRNNIAPFGFVYVFAAQNLIKIGMTMHSPYRRWHSIKTANPWLEPPLYVSPPLLGRVRIAEKAAHAALADHHVCGEWFECDRQLALETVRRIIHE